MKDKELRNIITQKLIMLRKETGLTQTQLGEIVGKKKTTVASWEQGDSLPDIETFYKLSQFYEKSLDYMYGIKDK